MCGGATEGECFRRCHRLRRPAEFAAVLKARRTLRSENFQLLVREGEGPEVRLGLVVAKRFVGPAVWRNLIKRVARESFRRLRRGLPACDLVLRVTRRQGAVDAAACRREVDSLFLRLVQ